jgi:hypothetical protein
MKFPDGKIFLPRFAGKYAEFISSGIGHRKIKLMLVA